MTLTVGSLFSGIGELASIGYNAEWRVVSAASVGGIHRRDRIFIVAYPNSLAEQVPEMVFAADRVQAQSSRITCGLGTPEWKANEPCMVGMDDGFSNWMDRLRGLGNAVVPQVAEVIGRLVVAHAETI